MNEFSFRKGYLQVRQKDVQAIKCEIMNALGIKARTNWYFRLYGKIEPKVSEARAIEEIFKKYGIKDIWGI